MRIAIVNDMLLAVEALRRVISSVPDYSVCWIARDGAEAVRKCQLDRPDLILMDMVMPVMDGAAATRQIMHDCPTAILVVTATIGGNFAKVFEAMSHGALDAVKTPELGPDGKLDGGVALLTRIAGLVSMQRKTERSAILKPNQIRRDDSQRSAGSGDVPLIAIGASTGGPQALVEVIKRIPPDLGAAIVIAQHITASFAEGLAAWLSEMCARPVRLAKVADAPRAGDVLLASTNDHLAMASGGTLRYTADPIETPYRPSVDVLFSTLAAHWRRPGVGVLLTGMGRDGAKGLLTLKDAGWHTIAEHEKTCVVYGMPAAAVEKGAAKQVLPVQDIGPAIVRAVHRIKVTPANE